MDRAAAPLRRCADTTIPSAPGWVHPTYRWVVENDTYLGTIDLRHELNDFLLDAGSHIGYSIRPSARRRGLATWALARTLERARGMGLDRLLLTCDPGNEASAATIVKRRTTRGHSGDRHWLQEALLDRLVT